MSQKELWNLYQDFLFWHMIFFLNRLQKGTNLCNLKYNLFLFHIFWCTFTHTFLKNAPISTILFFCCCFYFCFKKGCVHGGCVINTFIPVVRKLSFSLIAFFNSNFWKKSDRFRHVLNNKRLLCIIKIVIVLDIHFLHGIIENLNMLTFTISAKHPKLSWNLDMFLLFLIHIW